MVVSLQRIGKRILDHLRKKEATEILSKGQTNITREGVHQAEAVVAVETHIHSGLRTTCTTTVKPTITQKTAPYYLSPKERWSKTPINLRNNHHPEK
jgi:hypothetical protein